VDFDTDRAEEFERRAIDFFNAYLLNP